MEKINSELLISALLYIGFDKVDIFTYLNTLEELKKVNEELELFEFEDEEYSQKFKEFVEYDGIFFKLKGGLSFGNVSSRILESILNINRSLVICLRQLDFNTIVAKKIEDIGENLIDEKYYDIAFSNKEKEIIAEMNNSKLKC